MALVVVFAATLLAALLVSELAHRSVLSTAVLFLAAGIVSGTVTSQEPSRDNQGVLLLIEIALFTVLFTDGMRVGLSDLRSAWRLPGRALLLGLPLTLVFVAALAWLLVDVSWGEALLVGAILSPTDPVFAAAIVGRSGVPQRLRRLLNVESGLNDGLALPIVITLIAVLSRDEVEGTQLAVELLSGVAVGVVVPWGAVALERTRFFASAPGLAPLFPFAIGLLVFAICSVTHANLFLAAFAGGVTMASITSDVRTAFEPFGQLIAELLKVMSIFVFGTLLGFSLFGRFGVAGYAFALLTVFAARPLAIGIALVGSTISAKEWLAAAWFGPKGFASVVYALLVAHSAIPNGGRIFALVSLTVAISIVLHSSTDVIVARQFEGLDAPSPARS